MSCFADASVALFAAKWYSRMNPSAPDIGRVLVFGAGGHAKVVADALRRNGYQIACFVDDISPNRAGESFCGSIVVGGLNQAASLLMTDKPFAFIAIGANHARLTKASELTGIGFRFPLAVHPRAFVAADAVLGNGSVVCANASVGPATTIGCHAIVNTGASIDHDCTIGDGVHIGPGSVIAGYVTLGEASFVGAGAVIIDRVKVGHACTIGAGAVVIHDVPDGQTVVGVPARPVSKPTSISDGSLSPSEP